MSAARTGRANAMLARFFMSGLDRRRFLATTATFAAGGVLSSGLGRRALAEGEPIKIGFLAPLTGPVAAWGKPGLDGCQIWAERVNGAGGVQLADGAHPIEFVGYDDEYDPTKARTGATKLIRED